MKRSRAFRSASLDRLEGRLVLSQLLPSPATDPGVESVALQTQAAREGHGRVAYSVERTTAASGTAQVTNTLEVPNGGAGILTTVVTHLMDATTQTVYQTSTTSQGVTSYSRSILLPDGARQTEVGSELMQATATTIRADGTLQQHPGGKDVSQTSAFRRIITQTGLGTETILGITVSQGKTGQTTAVTDEQVTNFDGSQEEIKYRVTVRNGATTTRMTTLYPTGAVNVVTTTSRITSSS